MNFLTGAPVERIKLERYAYFPKKIWEEISKGHRKGHMHATTTHSSDCTHLNEFGLAKGHAYDLIMPFELLDNTGRVKHRMFMLRNPWGIETF